MRDLICGVGVLLGSIVIIILISCFCVWFDENYCESTRLENQKTELEIKRLQYEIKLLEEQGIPVDVE